MIISDCRVNQLKKVTILGITAFSSLGDPLYWSLIIFVAFLYFLHNTVYILTVQCYLVTFSYTFDDNLQSLSQYFISLQQHFFCFLFFLFFLSCPLFSFKSVFFYLIYSLAFSHKPKLNSLINSFYTKNRYTMKAHLFLHSIIATIIYTNDQWLKLILKMQQFIQYSWLQTYQSHQMPTCIHIQLIFTNSHSRKGVDSIYHHHKKLI